MARYIVVCQRIMVHQEKALVVAACATSIELKTKANLLNVVVGSRVHSLTNHIGLPWGWQRPFSVEQENEVCAFFSIFTRRTPTLECIEDIFLLTFSLFFLIQTNDGRITLWLLLGLLCRFWSFSFSLLTRSWEVACWPLKYQKLPRVFSLWPFYSWCS